MYVCKYSKEKTARTGQPLNRTAKNRTDIQNGTGRIGQTGQDRQNRTGRAFQAEQAQQN
jgi:hypothetical protein